MSTRDLDAAQITDPLLRAGFEQCRRIFARHGRSYYLATRLLPSAKRPYVWALYGFARYADDLVDRFAPLPSAAPGSPGSPGEGPVDAVGERHLQAERFGQWSTQFLDSLAAGESSDFIGRAMLATMRRWLIPRAHLEAFLEAMRADLTVATYDTYADLERYMYGSAAVIGLQMLPILTPLAPEATSRARALGEAFQLTNFIRDVGEDLSRGRVYLPQEDLQAFGVSMDSLARGQVTPAFRELMRFEIERARRLYAFAEPGILMVHPTSRPCLQAAFSLYRGILAAVEDAHFQVLTTRVGVSLPARAAVAWPGWRAARAAVREENRWIEA